MASMYYDLFFVVFISYIRLISGQEVASDPGVYGPPLEIVHLYYDQFPTGRSSHIIQALIVFLLVILFLLFKE